MIQLKDYFGKWDNHAEITEDIRKKASILISKVSELLSRAGIDDYKVSSGFRPQAYNAQVGGSKNSAHCFGLAVDIHDPDGTIGKWCMNNIEQLVELGLYMESLSVTHKSCSPSGKWVHLSIRRPKSGSTVFLP